MDVTTVERLHTMLNQLTAKLVSALSSAKRKPILKLDYAIIMQLSTWANLLHQRKYIQTICMYIKFNPYLIPFLGPEASIIWQRTANRPTHWDKPAKSKQ